MKSVHNSKKIIKDFKPDVVIGTGGYVSGAVVYAASKMHVPTMIHEQNSVVGLTNRFLSKHVDKIAVGFKDAIKQFPANKTFFLQEIHVLNKLQTFKVILNGAVMVLMTTNLPC